MRRIGVIIIGVLLSLRGQAQFTEIPTGTTANIYDMVAHDDTLILLGFSGYFAKYCVTTGDLTELSSPGITGYANVSFQVVGDNYYVLSKQIGAYEHNYILKSTDYGNSWDTLFHTPGLFYTMSMADSTFGVLGGAFGSKAVTDGSDTAWVLQDSLFWGVVRTSATYGDSIAVLETTAQSHISYNRGATWETVAGVFGDPQKTQLLNKDTLYSISKDSGPSSVFRRLTYAGSSWSDNEIIFPCTMNVSGDYDCYSTPHAMQMNHNGTGYILAYLESTLIVDPWQGEVIDKTGIFYTDNFGNTWTSYVTDIPEIMYAMEFLNDTTAFIGGENGLLYEWDLTVPLTNVLGTDQQNNNLENSIYPNPVKDFLHVPNYLNSAQYSIYSMTGKQIQTGYIDEGKVNLIDLVPGQYIFKVLNKDGVYTKQITKQ